MPTVPPYIRTRSPRVIARAANFCLAGTRRGSRYSRPSCVTVCPAGRSVRATIRSSPPWTLRVAGGPTMACAAVVTDRLYLERQRQRATIPGLKGEDHGGTEGHEHHLARGQRHPAGARGSA